MEIIIRIGISMISPLLQRDFKVRSEEDNRAKRSEFEVESRRASSRANDDNKLKGTTRSSKSRNE
ncbi:conserved hypothetical protein [Ricinus communis]|uniref:Uncharacterized protein n=1 Tax=Ricinus communis TaxID=3988 RepID=B9S6R8_RICCO|nr:conserved hypothetical protein [Ricinus communis]